MQTDVVLFDSPGKVSTGRADVPPVGPDEVLVESLYSYVSPGTEKWILTDRFRTKGHAAPPFPRIPGYQRVGRVLETGKDVASIEPGQTVFCALARFEEPTWMWGSHARLGVSPAEYVVVLPEGVKAEDAAALVILQVGFNAATRPPVNVGDVAVVVGDGLIGQFCAQILRARGAYVVLAGHRGERMELARRYTADEVIDSKETDLAKYVRGRWPEGVKIAVESVGRSENIEPCISVLAHDAHYVSLGFYPDENPFDLMKVHDLETTIYNPSSLTAERLRETMVALRAGKFNVSALTTHKLSWREAPEAYRMIVEKKPFSLGVLFDWREGGKP